MKKLFALFLSILLLNAHAAFALSLDEAKTQGIVGEQQNGYLGAVVANPEAQGLVAQINEQRRQKYFEIAKKNSTTLAAVEALAGSKAIAETAQGRFIQSASGEWKKK